MNCLPTHQALRAGAGRSIFVRPPKADGSNSTSGMLGLDNVNLVLSAAVRDGNGSRYPLVARIIATTARVPEVFKKAFAGFTFAPSMALA